MLTLHCRRITCLLFFVLMAQTLAAASAHTRLHAQLQKLCDAAPARALVSCSLVDCSDDRVIFQHHGTHNRKLASITKILVSSAALCELGADYQFTTSLYTIGTPTNGSIGGLGIIARGDPCLDEHFSDKKPNDFFIAWARKLRAADITHITGNIYIDASFFSGPIKPPTYPQDHSNQQKWYSAPASAFAWNDNCIEARAVPQKTGASRIEYRPHSPHINIVNRTKNVSRTHGKASTYFIISRAQHSNTLTVSGSYKKTTSWFPLAIHQDPNLLAGEHLQHILQQHGIHVSGKVIVTPFSPSAAGTTLFHEEYHTLLPALRILNQRSQNFYGEQILRVLGQQHSKQGSITAGCAAVRHYLKQHLSIDDPQLHISDGSGLSYSNSASSNTIAAILSALARHSSAADFYATLRTPRYAWAKKYPSRVKTGSLAVARCLSGYIDSKNGKRYAFSILLNKGQHTSIAWANRLREQLYKTMLTNIQ